MSYKKILLVTGASSEIGVGLIRKLAPNYETILAHYFSNKEAADKLKTELGDKIVLFQSDFTDAESIKNMLDEIDKTGFYPNHIVHIPAQKINVQKFHKIDELIYLSGFKISVMSIVLILKHLIPKMTKQKYGKVLFILTSLTQSTAPNYQAPYVTVKYALLGLMRDIAKEYADKGIMVNGVSPEMIETKFLSEMPELIIEQNAAANPLGRNLTVDDVIPIIEFLLSDGADTITGQNIGVTGG